MCLLGLATSNSFQHYAFAENKKVTFFQYFIKEKMPIHLVIFVGENMEIRFKYPNILTIY